MQMAPKIVIRPTLTAKPSVELSLGTHTKEGLKHEQQLQRSAPQLAQSSNLNSKSSLNSGRLGEKTVSDVTGQQNLSSLTQ